MNTLYTNEINEVSVVENLLGYFSWVCSDYQKNTNLGRCN